MSAYERLPGRRRRPSIRDGVLLRYGRAVLVRPVLPALALLAAVLPGCGDDGGTDSGATQSARSVDITVLTTNDTTRRARLTVRGIVDPATAKVRVSGRRATVRRTGRFSARIPLRRGRNRVVIDARADGLYPTSHEFTVTRQRAAKRRRR